MLRILVSLVTLLAVIIVPQRAAAAYVLPYPSIMPGHKLYRIARLIDEAKQYWYWGNLSSYRYYLGQSDKALVEVKTLFEYSQYLLAINALERSSAALQPIPYSLKAARDEGKNIEKYRREFGEAMEEHKRLIVKIREETPEQFTWTPEKAAPQTLMIHQALWEAERIRTEALANLP
ncbi:hypothetical protein HY411_01040 [Candidatus Gottesmanbacteria bacterium]|nr:hypothetical protein [Candidatus Gottesmanbacteria bacterium]